MLKPEILEKALLPEDDLRKMEERAGYLGKFAVVLLTPEEFGAVFQELRWLRSHLREAVREHAYRVVDIDQDVE